MTEFCHYDKMECLNQKELEDRGGSERKGRERREREGWRERSAEVHV